MDAMSLQQRSRYLAFVEEFFGSISQQVSLPSGLEMLKIAPEGLPRCYVSCGCSLGKENGKEGFELMFSTSDSCDLAWEAGMAKELERLGEYIRSEGDIPSVLMLGEELGCVYTHAMPWPVGTWEREGESSVGIFVLIPLYQKEAEWIAAHSVGDFAMAYHAAVSEEAFFHLDVARPELDAEKAIELTGCDCSL